MKNRGFSLVELIVAIAIGLIIMFAIYAASEMGRHSSTFVERKVVTQQDVRSALDLMSKEISMVSFNPMQKRAIDKIWKASDCNGEGSQSYKGLQIAKADEILIEMDISGNGLIGEKNEIIHYKYDKANNVIQRSTSCGNFEPFLGGSNAETNVINFTSGIKLFRYYNKAGTELDLDSDQTKIPDVRRVEITIAAESANIDLMTKKKREMIYSTSTIVRNHVLSF
jgi:prepilin-type N-terminal cleavage/methylation domain-containing protein